MQGKTECLQRHVQTDPDWAHHWVYHWAHHMPASWQPGSQGVSQGACQAGIRTAGLMAGRATGSPGKFRDQESPGESLWCAQHSGAQGAQERSGRQATQAHKDRQNEEHVHRNTWPMQTSLGMQNVKRQLKDITKRQ